MWLLIPLGIVRGCTATAANGWRVAVLMHGESIAYFFEKNDLLLWDE